jgi:RHS repeat-associated protein
MRLWQLEEFLFAFHRHQAGSGSYTYDVMGRVATETRSLIGANNAVVSKNMSYGYDLAGFATTLTYPSGKIITYTPDSAGRALSAVDNGSGIINYITGGITGFVSGSGGAAAITSAFTYNKRLQPVTMSATTPSQTVFSIGYDFHIGNGTSGVDDGNVYGITNYKDQDRNQAFTYDALNRLISAQNLGTNCAATVIGGKSEYWGNFYGYDAWGNLLQKSVTKCGAENLIVTADGHNWIHASGTDYQYDAAGNMTFNATPPTQNYTYDQENRLTGAAGYAYTYDADGNRAIKSNGSTGMLYWYMMPGVVAESDLVGTTKSEYIFFDGERAARRDGPTGADGVFYYFSDHLKTASVITDSAGVIKNESDFYPWGGELQFLNNDTNHYKFTGKERDSESGLDYFGARYYSNGMGRWVSADWSAGPATVPYAHLDNPQTLNLYSYVDNNPINGIDADGHAISHAFDGLVAGLDAGPPADEGGPTQTQAALTLAAMSNPAFGWQLEAQQAQNTSYTATILGQRVPVRIIGGTADDRAAIQGRLNGAIGDINQHAGDLSASDTKTIHNIKSITVDDSQRTGVDVKTGAYNLKSSYVMNKGSTAAWLASTIGHDAYHVTQFQQGEIYNKQTAPRLEREANQFQIRVGATFGLTQSQIDYIRNDTHTLYNTPPY